MYTYSEKQRYYARNLFKIYLTILIWIILFKMSFSLHDLPMIRSVNLIPLAGTGMVNNQLDYNEIINNILIFIPFGLYISMLKYNWTFLQKIAPIAFISLSFEILQYILAIGVTDITDFMGNTFGGMIGIILFFIIQKIFKNKTFKILNILGMIGTLLIVIAFIILFLGNGF